MHPNHMLGIMIVEEREIIQPNIYRILQQLYLGHNLNAKYHDPSSRDSPDILFTGSFMG